MSPNPTQGVDQCYVNPRCWAWQTSCDDSTSATEPPSLPSKIIFRLPRSSRLFFKVCIGNSATVSLDPLDHFAQETDIKQMYQRSTVFSRDTLSLCSFALDARFGGFNKKGEFGSDISTKNFRLCDFIIVICLLILWYLKWSFLIKYLNFKWYLWRLHVGLDLTENWRQMDLRWINSKEFSDQSSIFG